VPRIIIDVDVSNEKPAQYIPEASQTVNVTTSSGIRLNIQELSLLKLLFPKRARAVTVNRGEY
jgi:hypothetical protein